GGDRRRRDCIDHLGDPRLQRSGDILMARTARITRREAGFTLLEMLVVLAIMGLLAAIVAPQVMKYLGTSKTQTAKVQVQNITAALELYRLDVGRYPTTEEGLAGLVAA